MAQLQRCCHETAITGKGAEASKDVFAGLDVTIPLVSIRSFHQCLISALLPHYLFVVGNFIKHFYPFSFSYFLDWFSKHLLMPRFLKVW